jgi:hypothetical protein
MAATYNLKETAELWINQTVEIHTEEAEAEGLLYQWPYCLVLGLGRFGSIGYYSTSVASTDGSISLRHHGISHISSLLLRRLNKPIHVIEICISI